MLLFLEWSIKFLILYTDLHTVNDQEMGQVKFHNNHIDHILQKYEWNVKNACSMLIYFTYLV